jgi:DNA polymerase
MAASTGRAEPGAARFVPDSHDIGELAAAAEHCEGCELYRDATQTVFGAGPRSARVMLVGEQPGDQEDRAGQPFVGPAGRVLDRALAEAGIDRGDTFVTNAVKHFRFKSTASGKRRIHQKPSAGNISACRPWLAAELRAVHPEVLVIMGATAAQSVLGNTFRVTQHRGEVLGWPPAEGAFADDEADVQHVIATVHPSSVLRADAESRQAAYDALVADLRVVAGLIG